MLSFNVSAMGVQIILGNLCFWEQRVQSIFLISWTLMRQSFIVLNLISHPHCLGNPKMPIKFRDWLFHFVCSLYMLIYMTDDLCSCSSYFVCAFWIGWSSVTLWWFCVCLDSIQSLTFCESCAGISLIFWSYIGWYTIVLEASLHRRFISAMSLDGLNRSRCPKMCCQSWSYVWWFQLLWRRWFYHPDLCWWFTFNRFHRRIHISEDDISPFNISYSISLTRIVSSRVHVKWFLSSHT